MACGHRSLGFTFSVAAICPARQRACCRSPCPAPGPAQRCHTPRPRPGGSVRCRGSKCRAVPSCCRRGDCGHGCGLCGGRSAPAAAFRPQRPHTGGKSFMALSRYVFSICSRWRRASATILLSRPPSGDFFGGILRLLFYSQRLPPLCVRSMTSTRPLPLIRLLRAKLTTLMTKAPKTAVQKP